MHRCGSAYGLDVAGRVLALAEQKLNIIQATWSNQFWLWRGWYAAISAEKAVSTALAIDLRQPRMIFGMFQPGQGVRVNLAGLQAEGVMFQTAVTDAVGRFRIRMSGSALPILARLIASPEPARSGLRR
jgi:hypothetical protein